MQRLERTHGLRDGRVVPLLSIHPAHIVWRNQSDRATVLSDGEAPGGASKELPVDEPSQRGIAVNSRTVRRHHLVYAHTTQRGRELRLKVVRPCPES